MRNPTKAELAEQLHGVERRLSAAEEWLRVTIGQGEAPREVPMPGGSRVLVAGLTRARGGVAMVMGVRGRDGSARIDQPQYLDDLISRWRTDCAFEIRSLAETLSIVRDRALGLGD